MKKSTKNVIANGIGMGAGLLAAVPVGYILGTFSDNIKSVPLYVTYMAGVAIVGGMVSAKVSDFWTDYAKEIMQ